MAQHDNFLNELPNSWKFDRLKDVVALRNEKTSAAQLAMRLSKRHFHKMQKELGLERM